MKHNQNLPENEIDAPVSSTQQTDKPKSAHSTSKTEKYVKKRREKAEKQVDEEHKVENKMGWDWGSIKYVIL